MSKRVVIGEIGGGNYGMRVAEAGQDAINGSALQTSDKLSFDTLYPSAGVFIDRIYDITVNANSSHTVSYGKTYSPFPFIYGTYKNGNTYISDCYSIQTIYGEDSTNYTNALADATLGKGFYWSTTGTALTVYNETSSQKVFRMYILTLGAEGTAPITLPNPPSGVFSNTVTGSSFNVVFTAAGGIADGTRLDVSTSSDFSTGNVLTNQAVTSPYTVSSLSESTLYYYRLRSIDTDPNPDVYSNYTATYQRSTFGVNAGLGITGSSYITTDSLSPWYASCELLLSTDGRSIISRNVNSDITYYYYGSSTTSGIGSNYWVRFTQNSYSNSSGTGSVIGASTGVWLQLSSPRQFGVEVTGGFGGFGNAQLNMTAEISTNSSGTNIVASKTLTLTASCTGF